MTLDEFNRLCAGDARDALHNCCASERWTEAMETSRPYTSLDALLSKAETVWQKLEVADYLQAFEAHPKIGDPETLAKKYAASHQLAKGEQSQVTGASERTLATLAESNDVYFKRFGFIFIVFATGKSAEEMLQLLLQRIDNSREQEITNAAIEQLKITRLRLRGLISDSAR